MSNTSLYADACQVRPRQHLVEVLRKHAADLTDIGLGVVPAHLELWVADITHEPCRKATLHHLEDYFRMGRYRRLVKQKLKEPQQ